MSLSLERSPYAAPCSCGMVLYYQLTLNQQWGYSDSTRYWHGENPEAAIDVTVAEVHLAVRRRPPAPNGYVD